MSKYRIARGIKETRWIGTADFISALWFVAWTALGVSLLKGLTTAYSSLGWILIPLFLGLWGIGFLVAPVILVLVAGALLVYFTQCAQRLRVTLEDCIETWRPPVCTRWYRQLVLFACSILLACLRPVYPQTAQTPVVRYDVSTPEYEYCHSQHRPLEKLALTGAPFLTVNHGGEYGKDPSDRVEGFTPYEASTETESEPKRRKYMDMGIEGDKPCLSSEDFGQGESPQRRQIPRGSKVDFIFLLQGSADFEYNARVAL